MYVVGLSALDKDSSLTLFEGPMPVYAVSEERLTRVKGQDGFPWLAFEEMLSSTGITPAEIACVAYPFYSAPGEALAAARHAPAVTRQLLRTAILSMRQKCTGLLDYLPSLYGNYQCHSFCDRQLLAGLRRYGLEGKLRRYDHELCHAAAAFHSSGFERALVQISDWYGSGASGGIYLGENGRLTPLVQYRWPNSLGSFYARYTAALGFRPDRDEGKVLGLAAHGDASRLYLDLLREFTLHPDGSIEHCFCLGQDASVERARQYDRIHVAAAVQQVFETVLLTSLNAAIARTGLAQVCLAGGSMANVKLNQRIRELPDVADVFVFPAMADSGSGYGAACLALQELGVSPAYELHDVYLSRDCSQAEVARALLDAAYPAVCCDSIEVEVAHLLAAGKLVGRWAGRMEFGPRALGNRSILANPGNVEVNERLNACLQRDEFMPVAPSLLAEFAHEAYVVGIDQGWRSAPYMTMTFDVQPALAELIPAAVHVDGTARLQVVHQGHNPSYHRLIEAFYRLTGIPAVINTSFNMHGEPIVYSPADAISTFRAAHLDALALDSYLVLAS